MIRLNEFERRNKMWEINKQRKIIVEERKLIQEEKKQCTFEPKHFTKKERHNMNPREFYQMHMEYAEEGKKNAADKYAKYLKQRIDSVIFQNFYADF